MTLAYVPDEEDIRIQRVLDANGNETARLICTECGEEWEPPPGEEGLVCFECMNDFIESEYIEPLDADDELYLTGGSYGD